MSRVLSKTGEKVNATPRGAMTRVRRARIALRQGGRCALCNDRCDRLEIDHIIALEIGGADTDDNCEGLCRDCHKAKTSIDRKAMAKAKRLAGETCAGPTKHPIRSRGFDKTKTRSFSGQVRERTR